MIKELKPSTWYHIRLVIDYLGLKVTSDALNIHTTRAPPSTPTIPRLSVFPVRSSFDLSSELPSRLESLITWNSCYYTNGSPVLSYQVHLRRLDSNGNILNDEPPLLHKIKMDSQPPSQRSIAALLNTHQANNQWIQSPSKSEQQIRNSLRSRLQSRENNEKMRIESREKSPLKSRNKSQSKMSQSFSFSPASSLQSQQVQLQPLLSSSPQQQSVARHQSPSSGHSWRIIYDNLHRSLRMGAPRATDAAWQIRVRAKNSEGWSAFSPVLEVNYRTHPSLFTNISAASASTKSRQGSRSQERDSPEDADFNIDTANNNGPAAGSYMMMNSPLMQSYSSGQQQQYFQSQQQQQQAQQQQILLQEMVMFPLAGHAADIERPVSRMPKQFGDLDAAADGAVGRRPLVLPELVHQQQGGGSTTGNQSQQGSSRASSNHHR